MDPTQAGIRSTRVSTIAPSAPGHAPGHHRALSPHDFEIRGLLVESKLIGTVRFQGSQKPNRTMLCARLRGSGGV